MTLDDVLPYLTPSTIKLMIQDIDETAAISENDQNDTCDMIDILREYMENFE